MPFPEAFVDLKRVRLAVVVVVVVAVVMVRWWC